MKKKVLLPILLLAAMTLTGCNQPNSGADSKQESVPSEVSSDTTQYGVAIANKEALQGEWYANTTRDLDVTLTPAANPLSELGKNLSVTSSDPEVVAVTGLGLKSLKAGKATITVKYHEATDSVEVTILDNSAKAKYGVAHEGTAEDPFTNEDALAVAKSEKYEGEVYYVKGIVDRFYYAPGVNEKNGTAYFLKAATEGGEQFEIFKCFKEDGSQLSDDDIWVGGEATAYGAFTKYNNQYETSSAVFVKCDGTKPQPRQTLEKTFAEVLAVGAALKDGDTTWDYYKFQGYVTVKSGNDFYLTATKGEALVAGKSDEAHGSKDIKGTNAIELYKAGSVAELAAKLLEGAKVEVTMLVKNYHGTVENGKDLVDADVTVVEAGTPWAVPEPAVSVKTLAEFIELENTKAKAYNVTATVKSWKDATAEKDKYGNMILTDGEKDLVIYGASATETALAWDNAGAYAFKNPQDFLTNEVTKALNVGDTVTMKLIRADYTKDGVTTVQGTGIITKVVPAGAPTVTLTVADSIAVGDKLIMSAEGEHVGSDGTKTPFKKQFNGITGSSTKIGEAVDYAGDAPASDVAVLEVVAGSATGTFALKFDGKYLTWKSGNSLDVQDAVDANASWKFTFAEGKASIINSADAEGKRNLQYNSSNPRFATYGSSQKPVTLWKLPSEGGDTPVEKSVTVSSVAVAKKESKVYLQIAGTAANFAAADFLWALGLEHTGSASGGDGKTGFIVGKAAFEAADYTLPATLNADGSFLFEFDLSGLESLVAGSYYITAGVKGLADPVSIPTTKPETQFKDNVFSFYFRNDISNKLTICADELPPLSLTEATIIQEDGKIWAKIGGEVSSEAITQDVLNGYDSFVNFQNTNGWSNTRKNKADGGFHWVKEGTKAYIVIDVTFFEAGGKYNTHLNVKENTQANCKLETAIDQHYNIQKNETTWLDIQVFSDPTASSSDQSKFWGNLGFNVTKGKDPSVHEHALVAGTSQKNSDGFDVTSVSCECGKVGARMAVASFTGNTKTDTQYKHANNTTVTYKIIAPKAGDYELRIGAFVANNRSKDLSATPYTVKLGDTSVAVSTGSYEDLGIGTSKGEQFVLCPKITLAAGENVISITQGEGGFRLTFEGYVEIIEL